MVDFTKADIAFIAAARAMEKRASRVAAYIIINPKAVEGVNHTYAGRVVITFPADGAGRVHAVAWLPGDGEQLRHHGWAGGGGYDKRSAAMSGARFVAADGSPGVLKDDGHGWQHQLEDAGYIVAQAV